MKTYDVSGTVSGVGGLGWLNLLLKNAGCKATLKLHGKEGSFVRYTGQIHYEIELTSVTVFGINVLSYALKKLAERGLVTSPKMSGTIAMNGPFIAKASGSNGLRYDLTFSIFLHWEKLTGVANVIYHDNLTLRTEVDCLLIADDKKYDVDLPPQPNNPVAA